METTWWMLPTFEAVKACDAVAANDRIVMKRKDIDIMFGFRRCRFVLNEL